RPSPSDHTRTEFAFGRESAPPAQAPESRYVACFPPPDSSLPCFQEPDPRGWIGFEKVHHQSGDLRRPLIGGMQAVLAQILPEIDEAVLAAFVSVSPQVR